MAPAIQFELSEAPSDAISSLQYTPYTGTKLLVASWDKNVYLYDTHAGENAGGKLIQKFEHRAPVLDVCFGASEEEAYSAGMDWAVSRIDLGSGQQTVLSTHDAPVKAVVYSKEHSLVVSASWDCTLHFHYLDSSTPPKTITLPAKPHSLSLTASKLVVAMSSRLLHIYELSAATLLSTQTDDSPTKLDPWQQRESSLKFMTRAVACMPDDSGYASSSIEGRVAVEWFDPSPESQARKYAYKCHRQPAANGDGTDIVYPVNALAFHPIHGTFASGGGDGVVALWDAWQKRRIRQYHAYPESVAALSFSIDGQYLAVAVSPGFEDAQEDYDAAGKNHVFIRELGPGGSEAKGKSK